MGGGLGNKEAKPVKVKNYHLKVVFGCYFRFFSGWGNWFFLVFNR